ncbi:MAG TPA: anti-sigma factor [Streptosporangiaceae bacterium]|nr:anti-sigma factor [Streptosporangiaceae bacterium]
MRLRLRLRFLGHDLHSLSGAYALDALDSPAERDRFARHLSRCPSCAGEVHGLREVATALAFAATAEAPAEMRGRVLAAAARTRQLPPEVRSHRSHARPRRARPWVPWLSGAVAMASIAVAVFFGLAQSHTRDELNQARAQNQALSVVLSAPRVQVLSQVSTKGGTAIVVLSAERHELAVVTTGLPALPAGQVYQLWLISKARTVSAGLLPQAKAGQTPAVLATGVVKGDTLGLTVEPAPGSVQPSTKPIVALPLPV